MYSFQDSGTYSRQVHVDITNIFNYLTFICLATICEDDASFDCARAGSLFDVCADVEHARNVCPKFCGLCRIGEIFFLIYFEMLLLNTCTYNYNITMLHHTTMQLYLLVIQSSCAHITRTHLHAHTRTPAHTHTHTHTHTSSHTHTLTTTTVLQTAIVSRYSISLQLNLHLFRNK